MTNWSCGCGATNGVNLDHCSTCRRPRSESQIGDELREGHAHIDAVARIEHGFKVQLQQERDRLIGVLLAGGTCWSGCACPICAATVAPSHQDRHAEWHVRNLQ